MMSAGLPPGEDAERAASEAGPLIEITPSPVEYEGLCRDLATLRRLGAPSNTAAVLSAVHAAATRDKMPHRKTKTPGDVDTPPARQQEVES